MAFFEEKNTLFSPQICPIFGVKIWTQQKARGLPVLVASWLQGGQWFESGPKQHSTTT
jgi:hypothetical protein